MANFWKIVDKVILEAEVVLMVIDARLIEQTKNKELEEKVRAAGKTLITVINKCDLVDKQQLEKYKQEFHPCVFVSAQKFYGITLLRQMILRHAKEKQVTVGVVGYPNTGKSSVINSLKGKSSAGVSSQSGYTKGYQNIRVDARIKVIDTPGVISYNDEKGSLDLKITASITKNKDPELVVFELLKTYKKQILEHYGIKYAHAFDEEEAIELVAAKLNRMKKGGEPDTETTSRIILQDWQKGKIQL